MLTHISYTNTHTHTHIPKTLYMAFQNLVIGQMSGTFIEKVLKRCNNKKMKIAGLMVLI